MTNRLRKNESQATIGRYMDITMAWLEIGVSMSCQRVLLGLKENVFFALKFFFMIY